MKIRAQVTCLFTIVLLIFSCNTNSNDQRIISSDCFSNKVNIDSDFGCDTDSIIDFWIHNKANFTIISNINHCKSPKLDSFFAVEFLNPVHSNELAYDLEDYFYFFSGERYIDLSPKLDKFLDESSYFKNSELNISRLYFLSLSLSIFDKDVLISERERIDVVFNILKDRESTVFAKNKDIPNPFQDKNIIFSCDFNINQALEYFEKYGEKFESTDIVLNCKTYRNYHYVSTRIVSCYPALYDMFKKSIFVSGHLKNKRIK